MGLRYGGDVGGTGKTEEASEVATGILNYDFGVDIGEEGAGAVGRVGTKSAKQDAC